MRWYRSALELTPVSERRARLELEVRLGKAQRQAGDREYRTTLLAAAAAARDAGEHDVLVDAVLANHRRYGSLTGGVDRERVAMLRSAIDLTGDDPTVRARLLAFLASELTFDTDRNSTLAIADDALALARRTGDEHTLLAVHLARFLTVLAPDRRDDAIACSIDLLALARRLDDRAALVFAATYRAYACLWTADINGVDEALAIADAAAEPLGQPLLRHVVRVVQAMRASIAGRYDEAERLSVDAYELGRAGGLAQAAAHHVGQLYRIRLAQGRLDELVPTFEALVREQPAHPARRIVLCGLYCRLDRREDAEALFAEDAAAEFTRLPWDRYSLMMLAGYALRGRLPRPTSIRRGAVRPHAAVRRPDRLRRLDVHGVGQPVLRHARRHARPVRRRRGALRRGRASARRPRQPGLPGRDACRAGDDVPPTRTDPATASGRRSSSSWRSTGPERSTRQR